MAIADEINVQKKKMKDMTRKERFSYIWYYYRIHIIIALAVLIFLSSTIYEVATRKESAFSCAMVNSNIFPMEDTMLPEDYAKFAGIDTDTYDLNIENGLTIDYEGTDQMSYSYSQKITAMISSKQLDSLTGDPTVIDKYSSIGSFANLDEILPDDLKEKLKGKFEYYYYTYEEDGKVPVGVIITDSAILKNAYQSEDVTGVYSPSKTVVYSIAINAPHKENAIRFLEYLISEN